MGKPTEIVIACRETSPRLAYIARFLTSATGVVFKTISSSDTGTFTNPVNESIIIRYGDKPDPGTFSIFASGLLYENGIRDQKPEVVKRNGTTLLFPSPDGFDLPFDLFSAVFYMISRYEEYLPFVPDRYGRFEVHQSLAYRHSFHEEPIADQWLIMLKSGLQQKFPGIAFPEQSFRFVSTIDVDNPWAVLHRGFFRTSATLMHDTFRLKFGKLRNKIAVLARLAQDPFDTYAYIKNTGDRYDFCSLFFFLSGGYGRYDVNYALETRAFAELVSSLKTGNRVGIHPSCRSNDHSNLLESEFRQFTRLLGYQPEISRQHFLIIRFPHTYRNLVRMGIKTDYSMGWASAAGFRAGTSLPFRFYDLVVEHESDLLIHPFAVMDVSLRQYSGLDTREATEKISRLINSTKQVKGIFTSLWHNESLCEQGEWKGWRQVFEKMVIQCSENRN